MLDINGYELSAVESEFVRKALPEVAVKVRELRTARNTRLPDTFILIADTRSPLIDRFVRNEHVELVRASSEAASARGEVFVHVLVESSAGEEKTYGREPKARHAFAVVLTAARMFTVELEIDPPVAKV